MTFADFTPAQLHTLANAADDAGDRATFDEIHAHLLDTLRPLDYVRLLRNP